MTEIADILDLPLCKKRFAAGVACCPLGWARVIDGCRPRPHMGNPGIDSPFAKALFRVGFDANKYDRGTYRNRRLQQLWRRAAARVGYRVVPQNKSRKLLSKAQRSRCYGLML